MSTFHGLEMAKRALFAQQSALYTTGHNISNANTEGYSRQRVNFETMNPYPSASRNRPQLPGQMGTGVTVQTVERIRNKFLDFQFRAENNQKGYWDTKADALTRMENLLNEPSDSGLSKTLDSFWQSLQDLALNPDTSGAKSVVARRGLAVTDTFNYLSKTLQSIRADHKNQIEVTTKELNSLVSQINNINKQLKKIEPHGYLANDLYDERDRLVDKLSEIVNIRVEHHKSSETSLDIADGLISIAIINDEGVEVAKLIDKDLNINEVEVEFVDVPNSYNAVKSIRIINESGDPVNILDHNVTGSLTGLVEAYGEEVSLEDGTLTVKGKYPEIMDELDKMAYNFAKDFNKVHSLGHPQDDDTTKNFFVSEDVDFIEEEVPRGFASSITVNQEISKNPELIRVNTEENKNDGKNALELAKLFDEPRDFFASLIGDLGVETQEAKRNASNVGILRSQVEEQRMSVSAVSLDEEMTNMIRFQHAYNAAARSMTVVDEMIDRIINHMGIVGR